MNSIEKEFNSLAGVAFYNYSDRGGSIKFIDDFENVDFDSLLKIISKNNLEISLTDTAYVTGSEGLLYYSFDNYKNSWIMDWGTHGCGRDWVPYIIKKKTLLVQFKRLSEEADFGFGVCAIDRHRYKKYKGWVTNIIENSYIQNLGK